MVCTSPEKSERAALLPHGPPILGSPDCSLVGADRSPSVPRPEAPGPGLAECSGPQALHKHTSGGVGVSPPHCLPHDRPGPVIHRSTRASETEEQPRSKAAGVPLTTATTHPSPDSAATCPASTGESLGYADFRETHQNHIGESPEHGPGVGSVKAAGDVLCSPKGGTVAALRATGLGTAAWCQGPFQAPEMPSLQLPTCEMQGLEVCKHFPRRSTFCSNKILLRPQTLRALPLGTVCSLSMAPKSHTVFLRHPLHAQGHLCPCKSTSLDRREGLGTRELSKQQPHLGGQPPTPQKTPPPTPAAETKPRLAGEGSLLARGSRVPPHNPQPLAMPRCT